MSPTREALVRAHVLRFLPTGADTSRGFVAAGGDSLAALRLVTTLAEECGVRVPIGTVLRSPSVTALTDELAAVAPAGQDAAGPRPAASAVSAAQRDMLLEQTMGRTPSHLVAAELMIHGPLDVARLDAAICEVVARHGALRTRFWFDEEDFLREVVPGAQPHVDHVEALHDAELPQLRARALAVEMSLDEPLVPRCTLARLSGGRHLLIVVLHHLTCDGWSLNLVIEELMRLYAVQVGDQPLPPPAPAEPAGEATSATDLGYWTSRLADAPESVTVPPDLPRPAIPSFDRGRVALRLPGPAIQGLREASRAEEATLFAGFIACWMALFSDRAETGDVCVAVPVSGRRTTAQAASLGLFLNTVVIRERVDAALPFAEFLRHVHHRILEAQEHQDVPFSDVVSALAPPRALNRQPLAQVMVAAQPPGERVFTLPGGGVARVNLDLGVAEHSRYDQVVQLDESDDRPQGWIDYDADLYHQQTVSRLATDYVQVIKAATATPRARLQDLVPRRAM